MFHRPSIAFLLAIRWSPIQPLRLPENPKKGYISVFEQKDADHYAPIAKIPTALGARTAGYAGRIGKKGFDRLYLAVPARADRKAEVWIYTLED
jgi:hypothetical protein